MHFRSFQKRRSLALRWCLLALALAGVPAERALAQVIEPLPPPPAAGEGPLLHGLNDFTGGPTSPYPPMADPALPAPLLAGPEVAGDSPSAGLPWVWQLFPEGLIYRSYLAGVKEPRFALAMASQSGFGTIWDATLGARFSLIRYGTTTAYRPEGFEVDLEGAAMPRLQPVLDSSPLVSTDFRIGIPVTYGVGNWQFKTGYYHVSAHLGDEYMILHPGIVRRNYVRDAIMFGVGYFWTENMRLFAEFDYAAGVSDGAEPGEFQFGFDYSPAKPGGAPFLAMYGNLRQEVDYGGFFVAQTGWQWRGGAALHTFRIGVQYINGKSSQYEFFDTFEQHAGFGLWYDF